MQLIKRLRAQPGKKLRLADHGPGSTLGMKSKRIAEDAIARAIVRIGKLQYRLYAENKRALLVVLQGIDASGKDGTIRHVMTGLNPQGCDVFSFKAPSTEELDHDYLWRIHRAIPSRGDIGIFNRSHYEDLIVPRVHFKAPAKQWKARCREINEFERYLSENDVVLLKCFLHISKDEQKRRLEERLEDPSRHWKVNPTDFTEREHWDAYMDAFEGMLTDCSTPWAPWHVIPADHKWYRNYAVSQILEETLEAMDPKIPNTKIDVKKIKLD